MEIDAESPSDLIQLGDIQSKLTLSKLPLTLTQCKVKLLNSMQECFSLVFQAPLAAPPVQALYLLHHPVIGTAHIFLVPFKKTDEGLYYEAVFNRLLA